MLKKNSYFFMIFLFSFGLSSCNKLSDDQEAYVQMSKAYGLLIAFTVGAETAIDNKKIPVVTQEEQAQSPDTKEWIGASLMSPITDLKLLNDPSGSELWSLEAILGADAKLAQGAKIVLTRKSKEL